MTAHELARKLLEMPDIVVVVEDGMDPSDLTVCSELQIEKGEYFDSSVCRVSSCYIKLH